MKTLGYSVKVGILYYHPLVGWLDEAHRVSSEKDARALFAKAVNDTDGLRWKTSDGPPRITLTLDRWDEENEEEYEEVLESAAII